MDFDFEKLGIGFSRLLRYSYSGLMIILFMMVFHYDWIKERVTDFGTSLTIIGTIVIGTGVYALFRGIVIPIHHLIGIGIHTLCEKKLEKGIRARFTSKKDKSMNPVVWLRHGLTKAKGNGVQFGWGIIAYSYLRGVGVFGNEKKLNVKHAELGLVVMTSVFLITGAVYDYFVTKKGYGLEMFIPAVVLLLLSYPPALVQHALECKILKKKENEVTSYLAEVGLIQLKETGADENNSN